MDPAGPPVRHGIRDRIGPARDLRTGPHLADAGLLLEPGLALRVLPLAKGPEGTMDDEVGVAPDRAREVGVHVGGEAEVTQVVLVVLGQLHGAQEQVGHQLLLGLALDLAGDALEVLGADRLEVLGQPVAEGPSEVLKGKFFQ